MDYCKVSLLRSFALILTTALLSSGKADLSAAFRAQTSDTSRTSPAELRSYIEQYTGAFMGWLHD
jgi:hypothetical protein